MSENTTAARFPATSGDIAVASMEPMLEPVLGSRLVFNGRLDPAALSRATRLLLDLEPVLGCWIDVGLRGAEWVRCGDLDEQPVFSIIETTDPDAEALKFHDTAFGKRGPRLAVTLLRTPDRDELCVRLDHTAGDGWSAKEVTHLLAETYSRVVEEPAYVPEPNTAPRPSHRDIWRALTDEQRAAAENVESMLSSSKWKMRTKPGTGNDLLIRSLRLQPSEVASVRAYAHERGSTVNDALVAALIRSAAGMYPPAEGVTPGVSISADTRRRFPDGRFDRIAMIATTQTVMMDYRHGESFEQTLRHVSEGVRPYKDNLWNIGINGRQESQQSPFFVRFLFGTLTAVMRATHMAALVTMNVGPFDAERLVFDDLRPVSAEVTGVIPRYPGFSVTISSFKDTVTLWMGFRPKYMAPEPIERCLTGIATELTAACL